MTGIKYKDNTLEVEKLMAELYQLGDNAALVDDIGNIMAEIKGGCIRIYSPVITGSTSKQSDVYLRNLDKVEYAEADAAYQETQNGTYLGPYNNDASKRLKKRCQLLIVADTHRETEIFKNALALAKDMKSVDAVVHLGDFQATQNPVEDFSNDTNKSIAESTTVPLFMTPGNHDIGSYSTYVRYCKDEEDMYDRWVKPSVVKGFLRQGEYQEGKCYYYHDFQEYKVRLVMLYPFDSGSELDDTYWEAITYNKNYPYISAKAYSVGDCVNVPEHTKHSFRVKNSNGVTVTNVESNNGVAWTINDQGEITKDYGYDKVPRYKTVRCYVWYSQEQLDWFANVLQKAAEFGYTVVIGQHYSAIQANGTSKSNKPSESYQLNDTRFNDPYCGNGVDAEALGRYVDDDREIIAQILDKFINGGTINKTVYPYGKANPAERINDDRNSVPAKRTKKRGYYGVDDARGLSEVTLDYTFNEGGKAVLLNGHNHVDTIVKSDKFNLLQIGFHGGVLTYNSGSDTPRNMSNPKYIDMFTTFTVDEDKLHLTRFGLSTTIRVDENGKLINKDNEIIKFLNFEV